MEEVRIWVVEGAQAAPLKPAGRIENERLFEEALVKNPDLLMEGVTLVGRQTPTDGEFSRQQQRHGHITAEFRLTADEWETHKVKLTAFVQSVYKAWQNREWDEEA